MNTDSDMVDTTATISVGGAPAREEYAAAVAEFDALWEGEESASARARMEEILPIIVAYEGEHAAGMSRIAPECDSRHWLPRESSGADNSAPKRQPVPCHRPARHSSGRSPWIVRNE